MISSPSAPKRSIFYPASYLVMTVTSLLLLVAAAGLGTILINYWFNGVSNVLNDVVLLHWVASVVVVTPIHLLSYWQVRHTDKRQVTQFSLRFAHGLLGAYLLVTVGSFITLCTWLVGIWLNAWFGTGSFDKHLWAATLSLLQAIVWAAYATWHFTRVRSNESRPRYYAITTSLLVVVVLALSLAYPVQAYRDTARDAIKENDLAQINQGIGDYVDQHQNLPTRLSELSGLNATTTHHLGDYQYTPRGNTKFGIFGYSLCATFAQSKDKGHDTGFGFGSHAAGQQCFVRTTISFAKLNQDLSQDVKNIGIGATQHLQTAIQNFLLGTKQAVDQEVSGVEGFASSQVKQLEGNLEGLEGGTTELGQQMQQLEGDITSLQGNTGQLAQDFSAVQKFLHDLGCLLGGCR